MNDDLREGDLDSLVHEECPDITGELPLRLEDVLLLAVDDELEVDAAVRQRRHAQEDRFFLVEVPMVRVHPGKSLRDHFIQLLEVRVVGHADLAGCDRLVAGAVLEIADVRVVDHLEVTARIFDRRCADADVAHRAAEVVQNNDIAVDVLPLKDDEGACDDILDQALRAEAQDQSHNSDAREDRRGVDAEDRKAPYHADDHDQVVESTRYQIGDRLSTHPLFAKIPNDPLNDHIDDPEHRERKKQRQNVGQCDPSAPLDQEISLFQIAEFFLCLHRNGKPMGIEQQNDQNNSDYRSDQRLFVFHSLIPSNQ